MKCNDGRAIPPGTWPPAARLAAAAAAVYRVSGGSALASSWSGSVAVSKVGTIAIVFADNNDATATFSIDGAFGTKNMTRVRSSVNSRPYRTTISRRRSCCSGECAATWRAAMCAARGSGCPGPGPESAAVNRERAELDAAKSLAVEGNADPEAVALCLRLRAGLR